VEVNVVSSAAGRKRGRLDAVIIIFSNRLDASRLQKAAIVRRHVAQVDIADNVYETRYGDLRQDHDYGEHYDHFKQGKAPILMLTSLLSATPCAFLNHGIPHIEALVLLITSQVYPSLITFTGLFLFIV